MLPVDEVHDITECTDHTIASCRNLFCFLIHQIIRIRSFCCSFLFFVLAETITEPSHHKTWFESQRFILPYTWYSVTVYTYPALRIGCTIGGIEFILPETSAEDSSLTRLCGANTDGTKLAVTATNDNWSTFFQTSICSTFGTYFCNDRSRLGYRREDISAQATFFGDARIPFSALQIEDACG